MQKTNPYTVLVNQRHAASNRESQRMSEVSRVATQLQQQGMTRTEALRAAERFIPH